MVPMIISLVSGAFGGNLIARVMRHLDLGVLGNSVCGILGGGIGGQILSMLGVGVASGGALDLPSIVGNIASGGVGGGVLMAVVGFVKKLTSAAA